MQTDTVAMAQSVAIREVNASVLDKSIVAKNEQSETEKHEDLQNHKSADPSKGQNIDLFI